MIIVAGFATGASFGLFLKPRFKSIWRGFMFQGLILGCLFSLGYWLIAGPGTHRNKVSMVIGFFVLVVGAVLFAINVVFRLFMHNVAFEGVDVEAERKKMGLN